MKNLKLLSLSLAAVMILGSLAGCGAKAPKSASEVVERYLSHMEEARNYHMDMEMDFAVAASAQGMVIDMPVETDFSADVLDDAMHGEMKVVASVMDETTKHEMELYMDEDGKAYIYDSNTEAWSESEKTETAAAAFGFAKMDASAFTDAVLLADEKSGTYTVTQSFKDFADSGSVYGVIEDMYCSMYEAAGMSDMLDECEDAEIVYVFDEDCYLLSASITGCTYFGNIESNGVVLDIDVSIDFDFEFSKYGKIEADDVEVPDDVRDAAVTKNDKTDVDVNEGTYDDSDWNEDKGFGSTPAPSNDQELDPEFSVTHEVEGDVLGSYDGVAFKGQKDSWDIFGNDGWTLSEDDGALTFVTAENPKYDDVELYVYNSKRADAAADEIRADGFYGYSVDCSFSDARPPMTWNGITFGADEDDVIKAYGENYDLFEGDLYSSYRYMIADNTELTFNVFHDGGLLAVRLDYYGGI